MKTVSEVISPRLKDVLKYGEFFNVCIYNWNPSSKRVAPKNGKTLNFVRIIMTTSVVYFVTQVASILINRHLDSIMQQFQGTLFSFLYLTAVLEAWEWIPNPEHIQLLNLLCHGTGQEGKTILQ